MEFDFTEVYRTQLAKYAHLGHALWRPGPETSDGDIQIGDVGYFHEGSFIRLFNVHKQPGVDGQPSVARLPIGFEVLDREAAPIQEGELDKRQFKSRSINEIGLGVGASGYVIQSYCPRSL